MGFHSMCVRHWCNGNSLNEIKCHILQVVHIVNSTNENFFFVGEERPIYM